MWEAKGLEGQEAEIAELMAEIDEMEAEMGYVKPTSVEATKSEETTESEEAAAVTSDETAAAPAEDE